MPLIQLISDGQSWTGFQSVSIKQSMDNAAHTFSMTTTDRDNEGLDRWSVRGGSEVQILIDGRQVFDGFVQKYKPNVGPETHTITIEGASRAIDIIQASHVGPYFWKNVSAESIIAAVLEPFGIGFTVGGDMKAIGKEGYRVGVTDSPFAIVRKLAQRNGLTIYTTAANELILSKTPASTVFASIGRGDYVNLDVNHDLSQSFSEIIVKAQQNTTKKDFKGKQQVEKRFTNPTETRYRPFIISSTGTEPDQQDFGEFAKRRFAGNVLSATITVKSAFRNPAQGDREAWGINQLVFVDEPVVDVQQRLLISAVEFSLTEGTGFQTVLTLRLPEVFSDDDAERPKVRRAKGEFSEQLASFLPSNSAAA